mgnify:CR=1 FL=1
MNDTQTGSVSFKTVLLVLLTAVVVAVLSTIIQHLILGRSMPVVTGVIVDMVIESIAFTIIRNKSSDSE